MEEIIQQVKQNDPHCKTLIEKIGVSKCEIFDCRDGPCAKLTMNDETQLNIFGEHHDPTLFTLHNNSFEKNFSIRGKNFEEKLKIVRVSSTTIGGDLIIVGKPLILIEESSVVIQGKIITDGEILYCKTKKEFENHVQ